MNQIDPHEMEQVKWALENGLGLRGAQRKFGIHRDTVKKYFCILKGLPLPKWHGKGSDTVNKRTQKWIPEYAPVAPNTCGCGCGTPTTVYEYDQPAKRIKAGEYRKWVQGHYSMASARMKGADHISQPQKQKARDCLRKKIIEELHRDRFQTRDDLFVKFSKEGYSNVALGVILKNGCEDASYGLNEDDLPVPARKKVYKEPQGELVLRVIPYERETEIPLLVKRFGVTALDEAIGEGDTTRHELISSGDFADRDYSNLDPLEALIAKEEEELSERQALRHDRQKFAEWQTSNKPLTQFPEIKIAK